MENVYDLVKLAPNPHGSKAASLCNVFSVIIQIIANMNLIFLIWRSYSFCSTGALRLQLTMLGCVVVVPEDVCRAMKYSYRIRRILHENVDVKVTLFKIREVINTKLYYAH